MHPMPVILLLDRCDQSRHQLSRALRTNGLDTLCAATPWDALELALRHQPDLVIVSVAGCGFDGMRARRLLEHAPATARIPTLALTDCESGELHAELMAAGFHALSVRPDGPVAVVRTVWEMLGWLQIALES